MKDVDRLAAPGTPERELLDHLTPEALPRHVAIIMDGNGRWARRRGLPSRQRSNSAGSAGSGRTEPLSG